MGNTKLIIYQVFPRLIGNRNLLRKENGSIADNGCGKMGFFTNDVLKQIKGLGVTHIWYTGIIRHAITTDYTAYGIPKQNPAVIKGKAGSPYAITDYYDIDPDIAENVGKRMDEFSALINRTHRQRLKAIIDFVPNHVARQYQSIMKPLGVKDLGEDDDKSAHFLPNNNFYYCVGKEFQPEFNIQDGECQYTEYPAKATGNDHFDNHPSRNDWYETVKLNYGVDYCDSNGRSIHFDPIPDTWGKMADILLFWASKGVDGFRCDMAEMVPADFWAWAIRQVKKSYPNIIFVAEIYNPWEYHNYIKAGFDFLYDKVGMYDTMRRVLTEHASTAEITKAWQWVDDIRNNMLYFLENHDEQRIASDFYARNGKKAIPALIVNALMRQNPFMIYAGQEFGERGMDKEGFSGRDGRTTIFDYWTVESLYHGYIDRTLLTEEEKLLESTYRQILKLASSEKVITDGEFFDLMYVNSEISDRCYAFLRKHEEKVMLIVANFSDKKMKANVFIPDHAFATLRIPKDDVDAVELFSGAKETFRFRSGNYVAVEVEPNNGSIYKFKVKMPDNYLLNEHNKDEFPPAHTAEHLLNQTMVRMFGCKRSANAHIERKKSKISYTIDHKPSRKEEKSIVEKMNALIAADLPVTYEYVSIGELPETIDVSKLPDSVGETVRLVRIGDYDVCPCIGKHVRSTSQIGRFELLGTNWDEQTHNFRIRFKVVQ